MECIICADGTNSGELIVVTKGLQTISEASKVRMDDLHIKLRDVTSVTVHKNC